MIRSRFWRHSAALGGAWLAALCGCSSEPARYRHELVSGAVESVQLETGRLLVRGMVPHTPPEEEADIPCLLTIDSEVYINDKFSGFDAIRPGDPVEVIGYPDPSPRAERLVVCLAYITRREPPPREPDLLLPAAASRPQER